MISTGFKSSALVEIGSTLITVRPLTRLTLTEIRASQGSETLNVNLQTGRVRVDINPPAGTRTIMAVTSPVATASARGTSFEFDTRNLRVTHGAVGFLGKRGVPVLVGAGSGSRIETDGKPANPIDTKNSGLRPPMPGGTDALGSGGGGSTTSAVNQPPAGKFIIQLDY